MFPIRKLLILSVLTASMLMVKAQRTYKSSSVLASGNWYKFSVEREGIYKIDVSFLSALGIQGTIPSAQLRIYGNGGGMLPESNAENAIDDLEEIAVSVDDGGDGLFNGQDQLLFYSRGPDQWSLDSNSGQFHHIKNLFSNKAYYFITIGGVGKRVLQKVGAPAPQASTSSFDDHYFHELDTINFLSSGKEWFGEEMANAPGKALSVNFNTGIPGIIPGQPARINSNLVARSLNVASSFSVAINGSLVQQVSVPGVGTGILDPFAHQVKQKDNFIASPDPVVTLSFTPGSFNSQGWLNWFELFYRRSLEIPPSGQLPFRDVKSVGTTPLEFVVSNADLHTQVWDVSDVAQPVKMLGTLSGNQLRFTNDALQLKEYIAFSGNYLTPLVEGKVANQNLHASGPADYLIITPSEFLSEAQRLASFHQQHDQLKGIVVTTEQVYNEFAGGSPDPTALRNFVRMFYERFRPSWKDSAKYLLLFGKGSYDYKNRVPDNTALVPVYESNASLDPLSTYTSDDFYGFLDQNEDINSGLLINTLDIGIGRVPAKNIAEAKNFVDKVITYHSSVSLGPWRNNIDLVADDEDNNLHLQDAESLAAAITAEAPLFNVQKIYLDAFRQESGSSGGRYPQANIQVDNSIYTGTLIWNYSGHGGSQRLAEEVVLDQSIVNKWENSTKLPLFITATCDFAPYDNPLVNSLGENILVRPKTGGIGLMTTSRVVFAYSNRIINENYLKAALKPDSNGHYKTLGAALMDAKNFTYLNSGDIINNRKFVLLGDPAMTLGFPELKVDIKAINGKDVSGSADTLSAAELVSIEGFITDLHDRSMSNFNGTAYLSILDKPETITTLGNDPGSFPVGFSQQANILFKGKASVENGRFLFRFRLPKDINYQYGNGKLSLYAENGSIGGSGYSSNVIIGGIDTAANRDYQGPEIKAYLNDEKFVNGSITNSTPVLLVKLVDSSGINTVSSGIGHDLVATLDNDNNRYYVLNNFYETDLDNFQKGTVRFQLPELAPGHHTLKIKAWDVTNNSSEYLLEFTVIETGELKLEHVLNYPNPFTTSTSFWFEHNHPFEDLYAKVEVFTISGKLIKTLTQTINSAGNRSNDILWDGRDEYGNKLGRGVYIYRLKIRTSYGITAEKWERLVIL
jgi:hypothetical protein